MQCTLPLFRPRETCYRQSQISFAGQFLPRSKQSSEFTDSEKSEQPVRVSTEYDRPLEQLWQSQLQSQIHLADARLQHLSDWSQPGVGAPLVLVPWYRAFAVRVISHRDFEFVVICITIMNCVGLALYRPLQPLTHPCNVWMDTIGTIAGCMLCIQYCTAVCRTYIYMM